MKCSGFTLVEVSMVLGIFAILTAMASLNLTNLVPQKNLDATVQTLVADIKSQQTKAMSGEITASGSGDNFGVYFSNNKYTLFNGDIYSASATDNFEVALDQITISSTFPASTLIFIQDSGQIKDFLPTANTIHVSQVTNNITKVITIDKYGAILSIL